MEYGACHDNLLQRLKKDKYTKSEHRKLLGILETNTGNKQYNPREVCINKEQGARYLRYALSGPKEEVIEEIIEVMRDDNDRVALRVDIKDHAGNLTETVINLFQFDKKTKTLEIAARKALCNDDADEARFLFANILGNIESFDMSSDKLIREVIATERRTTLEKQMKENGHNS